MMLGTGLAAPVIDSRPIPPKPRAPEALLASN